MIAMNYDMFVLISIQPKWCELIASGKKTIEVRKNRPKLALPFKCYIYESRGDFQYGNADYHPREKGTGRQKVIGEFVCDGTFDIECSSEAYESLSVTGSCLTMDDILNYSNGQTLYGWHISNLKIYDTPMELSKYFIYCGDNPRCDGCPCLYVEDNESVGHYDECCSVLEGYRPLMRPPQSWCYISEFKEQK
jgi:predicted transcriptional regulator